eukprot:5880773-Karenia_brevis.AAC.1
MRSAWSDACEAVSRIAKRAAEGLASYDIDEPLDVLQYNSLRETFTSFYKFSLPPRKIGTDSMIARFYRELQARHPTMWSMTRTRSLAAAQRQDSSKRHKLTESVEISLVG